MAIIPKAVLLQSLQSGVEQNLDSGVVTTEMILLVLSLLFFVSLIIGKAGSKYGVPALLLFLSVGMIAGEFFVDFNNYKVAQAIGTIALSVILFSGGMDTKLQEIRPVIIPGIVLASVGVILTAFIAGPLIWVLYKFSNFGLELSLVTCLLLASIMSSTDSASVFSILRSKGVALKNNLRPLLELESGSNDPMAYMLIICLISIINTPADVNYLNAMFLLIIQFLVGSLSGYFLGKLIVFIVNHIKMDNAMLYPILVFTGTIFVFSFTNLVKGNNLLAVYICGLVIGNSKILHKRSTMRFFDSFTWLCQILMFLTLGLLVDSKDLFSMDVVVPGIIISILLILVARPAAVFLSLFPVSNVPTRDKFLISWVGLRGAVPIIFAIIVLAYNVPHAEYIFKIVFFVTLTSLLIQGTTITRVAKILGLEDNTSVEQNSLKEIDFELCSDTGSITIEIVVNEMALKKGSMLIDLPLPEKTVVVLVKRQGKYFVPMGNSHICLNDVLLLIMDDEVTLAETYRNMGIALN